MAKKKGANPGKKAQYNNYKVTGSYEKNRKRTLSRHIKNNPNDEVAKKAINNISYRRKKPKNRNKTVKLYEIAYKALMLNAKDITSKSFSTKLKEAYAN